MGTRDDLTHKTAVCRDALGSFVVRRIRQRDPCHPQRREPPPSQAAGRLRVNPASTRGGASQFTSELQAV